MYERDGSDDHGECPNYEPVDEVVGYSFREMLKEKGKFDSSNCQAPPPQVPTSGVELLTTSGGRDGEKEGGRTGRTSDEEADIHVPHLTSVPSMEYIYTSY
ncbi:hypothetical protein VI817_009738 [Penicillium citrinum]|uniref:Uncharacterized protein n=1 Tax=Penicillium hetheringtonii TaxID=911720 RepID=A0AAD6GR02_9EURO|nr:hypothetical protein N7450_006889 [Penicillium hetheringtonii]KAK5788780.1 hypothetical protein VI817_009738 [Penicillium citrinum]